MQPLNQQLEVNRQEPSIGKKSNNRELVPE